MYYLGSGYIGDRNGRSTKYKLWLDISRYKPLIDGSYIQLTADVKHEMAAVNVAYVPVCRVFTYLLLAQLRYQKLMADELKVSMLNIYLYD